MHSRPNIVKTDSRRKIRAYSVVATLSIVLIVCAILLIPLSNKDPEITGHAETGVYRVINDGTKVLPSPPPGKKEEKPMAILNRGMEVKVLEVHPGPEGKSEGAYYIVASSTKSIERGYVRYEDLEYVTVDDASLSMKSVKASSKKLGDKIKLYKEGKDGSEVAYEVRDGQRLQVLDEGNAEFYSVVYKDQTVFVKKGDVTSKLSHGQMTALIVAIVTSLTILLVFSLIYLSKNVKDKRMRNDHLNNM